MSNAFPGEPFFQVALPNYEQERLRVTSLLLVSGIFWMFLFPGLLLGGGGGGSGDSAATKEEHNKGPKVLSRKVVTVRRGTATKTATTTTTTRTAATTNSNNGSGSSSSSSVSSKASSNHKTSKASETPKLIGKKKSQPAVTTSSSSNRTSSSKQQLQTPPESSPSVATATYSILGFATSAFYILMTVSSYNAYTARRVFSVPLLTLEETQHIREMAAAAAERNYQTALKQQQQQQLEENNDHDHNEMMDQISSWTSLLEEPTGWQKTRHGSYPTTDLNLVTDPFLPQDRAWLGHVLLDQRLAPTLARVYGIPINSIRANDIFIVRYDANLRAHLANHTDDSDVSFVCLLNEGFDGGGTRFWDRLHQTPFAHVQPNSPGECSFHSALIHHEGYHVSAGTRMILVGFLSIDRIDPFTGESTGLPTLASWGSWSWLQVKFKQALKLAERNNQNVMGSSSSSSSSSSGSEQTTYTNRQAWTESKYLQHLFADTINLLQFTGDFFATHVVEQLVAQEQKDLFLQALDQQRTASSDDDKNANYDHPRATWWHGQQIDIDMNGKVAREWRTRRKHAEAFEDL